MWFYGWGFYALGQDDTLERKLTERPAKSLTSPKTSAEDVDASSQQNSPRDTLPRPEERRGSGSDLNSNAQASAATEEDGIVVIDIDRLARDSNSTTTVVAAPCAAGKGDGRGGMAGCKQRVSRILLSPNIIAVAIGVVIAMIAPLQKMLFDSPRAVLRPLGAAFEASLWGFWADFLQAFTPGSTEGRGDNSRNPFAAYLRTQVHTGPL